MIAITSEAQAYFCKLITDQDVEGLGLRMEVTNAGTPRAECELSFCEAGDAEPTDSTYDQEGFVLYVDAGSSRYLADAQIDFVADRTGGQLVVRAPNIKGSAPSKDDPLDLRVQYVLDSEINPMVAAHGGQVALMDIDDENYVVLQFGGGCHGCGMVNVTLKEGVEKTLLQRIPELAGVKDATDHSTGENPYM